MAEEIKISENDVNTDAFLAAKQLDTLRMEALDYSIKKGLAAAQEKYPTLEKFLAEWEGKDSGDYIEDQVNGGFGF